MRVNSVMLFATGILLLTLPVKTIAAMPTGPAVPLPPDLSTTTADTAFAGLPDLQPGQVDLRIQGEVTSGGLTFSMELGRVFTRGIKVYSEPSHTLIVAGMASDYASTPSGLAIKAAAQATFTTQFPNAAPRIQTRARPTGDYGVVVYAITASGDFLVAAGKVGSRSFGWNTTWHRTNGLMDPTHCCSGGGCDPGCIDCDGPYFTCCLLPCDCSITCGWVQCGSC
jgi:hypothetical protein